jgi:hypothetical protein
MAWADLENSLAILLSDCLGTGKGRIGTAIYFAPAAFDTRLKIVDAALAEVALASQRREAIMSAWTTTSNAIGNLKETRNRVAHGCVLMVGSHTSYGPRIKPPMFDIKRQFNRKTGLPDAGLSAHDIRQSTERVHIQAARVRLIWLLLNEGDAAKADSLLQKLAELKGDPQTSPPQPSGRKSQKRRAPP